MRDLVIAAVVLAVTFGILSAVMYAPLPKVRNRKGRHWE